MEFYMDDKNAQLAIIYIGKYIYTCKVDVTLVSLMDYIWKLCRCFIYKSSLPLSQKKIHCLDLQCASRRQKDAKVGKNKNASRLSRCSHTRLDLSWTMWQTPEVWLCESEWILLLDLTVQNEWVIQQAQKIIILCLEV